MRWTAEGQLRDSTRSIPICFQHNENESTIKTQTSLGGSPLRSDVMDETGDANRNLVWVTHRTTGRGGQTMIGHSHSRHNSRRAANVEREVGQPSIVYMKRRLYTETVGGISHGSVPCLRPMGHADRPPEVEYTEGLCYPNWELKNGGDPATEIC